MNKINYHFFGKNLPKNFSTKNTIFPKQIHSDKIVTIQTPEDIANNLENPQEADAIISTIPGQEIGIVTADCVPIFLFDKESRIIAAIHAGWRGALSEIVPKSIKKMEELGAIAENMEAVIGPCIRQESYEVGAEIYEKFCNLGQENSQFFAQKSKLDYLTASDSILDKNYINPHLKFMFDLPGLVRSQISQNKIIKILDEKIDTYQNQNSFYSYRKNYHDKLKFGLPKNNGRNISIIR